MIGGFIPLAPYMVFDSPKMALGISAIVTLAALFIFGYLKGHFAGTAPLTSALQTLSIGGLGATMAFVIARLIT